MRGGTVRSMANAVQRMDADDLGPTDEDILDVLQERGNCTKGALVDWTGYSRNTIYNHLEKLEAGGVVECIHEPTRLFAIKSDPRVKDVG